MLKKLSLLFIKFSVALFTIDIFTKIILLFCPINLIWIDIVDGILKILLIFGFIILSFTFKFCIYHRILLYMICLSYMCGILYLLSIINANMFVNIIWIILVSILVSILIIYIYLNGRNKETITRK